MSFRKWYFAVNKNAIRDAFDLVHVAVVSAKKNTSLIPVCLIEDADYDDALNQKIKDLRDFGVRIIRWNAEIFPEIERVFGVEKSAPFNGHWLRTDIPVIEQEDDYVLYTDFDVMFRRDPTTFDLRPAYMSCAPEHGKDDWSYFNSGVILMNLPALRETREEFLQVVRDRISQTEPHNDQLMLNICYEEKYTRLPLIWNWKPYWGFNDKAEIVHFHGPKPGVIKSILGGYEFDHMPIYHEMHGRSPDGYAAYMSEFDDFLKTPLTSWAA